MADDFAIKKIRSQAAWQTEIGKEFLHARYKSKDLDQILHSGLSSVQLMVLRRIGDMLGQAKNPEKMAALVHRLERYQAGLGMDLMELLAEIWHDLTLGREEIWKEIAQEYIKPEQKALELPDVREALREGLNRRSRLPLVELRGDRLRLKKSNPVANSTRKLAEFLFEVSYGTESEKIRLIKELYDALDIKDIKPPSAAAIRKQVQAAKSSR